MLDFQHSSTILINGSKAVGCIPANWSTSLTVGTNFFGVTVGTSLSLFEGVTSFTLFKGVIALFEGLAGNSLLTLFQVHGSGSTFGTLTSH